MQRALECADGTDHRGDQVGARGGDDARRESRGVHPVVADRDEVPLERARRGRSGSAAGEHAQVIGRRGKVFSRCRCRRPAPVTPPPCVYCGNRRHHRGGVIDEVIVGLETGENRAQGVHRIRHRRSALLYQHFVDPDALPTQPCAKFRERGGRRQFAVPQEVADLLEAVAVGKLLHPVARDDELAGLAVDAAEASAHGHHVLESASAHFAGTSGMH